MYVSHIIQLHIKLYIWLKLLVYFTLTSLLWYADIVIIV